MMQGNIDHSVNAIVTTSIIGLQLAQMVFWFAVLKKHRVKLCSYLNLPYAIFCVVLTCVIVYFFIVGRTHDTPVILNQTMNIALDVLVWFLAILCFVKATSRSLILISIGSLLIFSADISIRCLFMVNPLLVQNDYWIHIVRVIGIGLMAYGIIYFYLKDKLFRFNQAHSLEEIICVIVISSALVSFIIGSFFLTYFATAQIFKSVIVSLWDLPVALVFAIITAVGISKFSINYIVSKPLNSFIDMINKRETYTIPTSIYEWRFISNFVRKTVKNTQALLDKEIILKAQLAHDIRSPLTTLLKLRSMPLSISDNDRMSIVSALDQVYNLTNSMMSVNNHHKHATTLHLNSLVEKVIAERKLATNFKNIYFINKKTSQFYFTETISYQLQRALSNIINNAIEATNTDFKISLFIKPFGNFHILTVSDQGHGIPNKYKERIFTHGFTTKATGKGIGLHSSKEIIKSLHGDITYCDNEFGGTDFNILIPKVAMPASTVTHINIFAHDKVIIVDDSRSLFETLKTKLQYNIDHNEIFYCPNQVAFVQITQEHIQDQYLILIDHDFINQEYSGIELILEYQDNFKNARFYLITSWANDAEIIQKCQERRIAVISKVDLEYIEVFSIKNKVEHVTASCSYGENETIDESSLRYQTFNHLITDLKLLQPKVLQIDSSLLSIDEVEFIKHHYPDTKIDIL
ncbi:MAG: sensor histidine kinase [Proteobacteria bacterium]|nr:sensor histidine kinase [Pseudomonadota bacterium]